MNTKTNIEAYQSRDVTSLGLWEIGPIRFKVYGLAARDKHIPETMLIDAQNFTEQQVLPEVYKEGKDNGLGFIIIHAGDDGVSTSVHWWIQGSVLCQKIHRKLYSDENAMDTTTRPVVACVWELAIINSEQEAWKSTMMTGMPNSEKYLDTRG